MEKTGRWFYLVPILISLWFALAGTSLVYAQTPSPAVTLAATPATVQIAPGQEIEIAVVATIPVTTVRAITLTQFTDVAIDAAIVPSKSQPQSLRGSIVWDVTLKSASNGPKEGSIHFRADYLQEMDGILVPGVAFTEVQIDDRDIEPLSEIINAEIDSTLETLKDQQTGQVYLRISNLSDVPIKVKEVRPFTPSFLETVLSPTLPITLEARQTRALAYQFNAKDAVIPGKHELGFEVVAEWQRNARTVEGTVVLTRTLNFEVVGQEFLGFAQIPSILLLPGILAVTAFFLMYQHGYPKKDVGVVFTKPEFWLSAVVVSIVVGFVAYPLITRGLLPSPRSITQSYGLVDIVSLWIGSVVLGVVGWAFWGGFVKWRAHAEKRRLKGLQVNEIDYPSDVLKVLANHHEDFNLQSVNFVKQEEGKPTQVQQVFRLPTTSPDPDQVWVIPQIRLFWENATTAQREEFSKAFAEKGNPRELARILDSLVKTNTAIVDWDQDKLLVQNPMLVAKILLKRHRGVPDPLINESG